MYDSAIVSDFQSNVGDDESVLSKDQREKFEQYRKSGVMRCLLCYKLLKNSLIFKIAFSFYLEIMIPDVSFNIKQNFPSTKNYYEIYYW